MATIVRTICSFPRRRTDREWPLLTGRSANRGCGAFDIAYLLSGDVSPAMRRAWEMQLLNPNWGRLCWGGIGDYSFDECVRDYRLSLLLCLVYIVISIGGLNPANERGVNLFRIASRARHCGDPRPGRSEDDAGVMAQDVVDRSVPRLWIGPPPCAVFPCQRSTLGDGPCARPPGSRCAAAGPTSSHFLGRVLILSVAALDLPSYLRPTRRRMDFIFTGDLASRRGRAIAWADSLLVDHGLIRLAWSNAASVIPGRLYRSNHPSPRRLAAQTKPSACAASSACAARPATARTRCCARPPPGSACRCSTRRSTAAVRPAASACCTCSIPSRAMPEPALIFCKSGADRAGFAASLFVLHAGGALAAAAGAALVAVRASAPLARRRAGCAARPLRRRDRRRASFADWVRRGYDPEAVQRDFRAGRIAGFVNDRLLARE